MSFSRSSKRPKRKAGSVRKPSRQASTAGRGRRNRSVSDDDSTVANIAVAEEEEEEEEEGEEREKKAHATGNKVENVAQKAGLSIAGELNAILKAPPTSNKALSAASAATRSSSSNDDGGGGGDADGSNSGDGSAGADAGAGGEGEDEAVPELEDMVIKPKPVPKAKRMSMNIAAELNAKMLGSLGAGGVKAGLKSTSEANPKQKRKAKPANAGPALADLKAGLRSAGAVGGGCRWWQEAGNRTWRRWR